jgi:predicted N-formylglutamate amidohydrolase
MLDPASPAPETSDHADAVLIENPRGVCPLVLACDHASNHVPSRFAGLGLSASDLVRHIAWDPGALGVARAISARLDATLVAAGRSRLIIDCNRDPGDADSIPSLSETTEIPGNRALSADERRRRIAEVYKPFHSALASALSAKTSKGPTSLVSIHSFTPIYRSVERPWSVGVLFDADQRLSRPIIERLSARPGLNVGVNQPYSPGDGVYHTLHKHGQSRGRPTAMIEIRNDLIATPEDERGWGEHLADILAEILPRMNTGAGVAFTST